MEDGKGTCLVLGGSICGTDACEALGIRFDLNLRLIRSMGVCSSDVSALACTGILTAAGLAPAFKHVVVLERDHVRGEDPAAPDDAPFDLLLKAR